MNPLHQVSTENNNFMLNLYFCSVQEPIYSYGNKFVIKCPLTWMS